ncbi:hypothetical protein F2Q69_00004999 [Brassica cretica]|uniref:Fe2OG dioxygenase domain-containing protein n=1 Tax=Brassica cretica TaxID=69181 RepID=A0A8S9NY87_BRACR|nr:hypothetical protein F2Q69_00004999 [Brassica cretica]
MEVKRYQPTSPPSETIPIVDLSNPAEELVSRAVVKASQEWGVFHVVNHGISMDLIQRLKEVGKQFFELPEKEKKAVAKPDDSQDFEGYTRNLKYTEGEVWADNLFHRILPQSCINYKYWPRNPPEYREVIEEYTKETKKLSERLLGFLSEGLGLRHEALKEGLGGEKSEYVLRINNFPPNPQPDATLGLPEHTDIVALALIVTNEVPGLQVFHEGHWFDVHVSLPHLQTLVATVIDFAWEEMGVSVVSLPQSKPDLCSSLAVGLVCASFLVDVFCFCQRLPLSLSGLSDIVASSVLALDDSRFRLVIAACASSLATNRSSSGLHFASLFPCAFSSRAVMLTVQVDRVFGLRLLGLCALVASSVLSRIGLVLGGMNAYLSSLSRLSSCPHLEALGLAHSKRFLGSFYFCRLSNGKYKNVLHRVTVDKEKQRMSWPVFVDANPDVVIRPLPELITGVNPSMFKSIICKDFKYRRLYKLPVD